MSQTSEKLADALFHLLTKKEHLSPAMREYYAGRGDGRARIAKAEENYRLATERFEEAIVESINARSN